MLVTGESCSKSKLIEIYLQNHQLNAIKLFPNSMNEKTMLGHFTDSSFKSGRILKALEFDVVIFDYVYPEWQPLLEGLFTKQ